MTALKTLQRLRFFQGYYALERVDMVGLEKNTCETILI